MRFQRPETRRRTTAHKRKMLALSQFQAEKEPIQILPRFRLKKLKLVSGEVGPFISQSPTTVPLWLALSLRKQSRCTIIIPDWLSQESLESVKKLEKESSKSEFQPLHDRYREIAALLLHHAAEDFEDPETIRRLVADIEDLRQHKIREGMQSLLQTKPATTFLNLTDLSALELNEIRPFLLQGLGIFDQMDATLQRSRERQALEVQSSITQVMHKGGRKLTKYS